jgi:hypothetical protein
VANISRRDLRVILPSEIVRTYSHIKGRQNSENRAALSGFREYGTCRGFLIAAPTRATNLRRRPAGVGVEFDPLYVDVIVRRYEAATGNHGVLVETGETLEALGPRRVSETVPV